MIQDWIDRSPPRKSKFDWPWMIYVVEKIPDLLNNCWNFSISTNDRCTGWWEGPDMANFWTRPVLKWLISKISPISKKSGKNEVSNIGQFLNCAQHCRFLEKSYWREILEIQNENGVDLTSVEQHGFKSLKGTASAA